MTKSWLLLPLVSLSLVSGSWALGGGKPTDGSRPNEAARRAALERQLLDAEAASRATVDPALETLVIEVHSIDVVALARALESLIETEGAKFVPLTSGDIHFLIARTYDAKAVRSLVSTLESMTSKPARVEKASTRRSKRRVSVPEPIADPATIAAQRKTLWSDLSALITSVTSGGDFEGVELLQAKLQPSLQGKSGKSRVSNLRFTGPRLDTYQALTNGFRESGCFTVRDYHCKPIRGGGYEFNIDGHLNAVASAWSPDPADAPVDHLQRSLLETLNASFPSKAIEIRNLEVKPIKRYRDGRVRQDVDVELIDFHDPLAIAEAVEKAPNTAVHELHFTRSKSNPEKWNVNVDYGVFWQDQN